MAIFKLMTGELPECRIQTRAMDRFYYSIDTANNEETKSWGEHNPYTYTCALIGDEAVGYLTLMPLKQSTNDLILRQDLPEEDITPDHLLGANAMHHAQYLYLPAITVKDFKSFRSRQAVAALLSGMASYMLNMYDVRKLKAIYANPTTFQGNLLIKKMGFKPLHGAKKPLSGLDIYYTAPSENIVNELRALEKRYAHLVSENPWPEMGKVSLEPVTEQMLIYANPIMDDIEGRQNESAVKADGVYYLAKYRGEYIGLARKASSKEPLWYGLHSRWRGRGLGAKLKAAIESAK
jgi:hypothetical protein